MYSYGEIKERRRARARVSLPDEIPWPNVRALQLKSFHGRACAPAHGGFLMLARARNWPRRVNKPPLEAGRIACREIPLG